MKPYRMPRTATSRSLLRFWALDDPMSGRNRSDASASRTAGVVNSAGDGDDGGVAFKTCQSCEQAIPKGARYCPVCGKLPDPQPPEASPDVPLEQRPLEPLHEADVVAVAVATVGLLAAVFIIGLSLA